MMNNPRGVPIPNADVSPSCGGERLQHSPSVEIPPHASLSPLLPACYPVSHTRCATLAIDAILFGGGYLIFRNFPLSIPLFTTFFHFMGESIASIASIADQCVLNLNLTDGSKTNLLQKYCNRGAIYCSWSAREQSETGGCNS